MPANEIFQALAIALGLGLLVGLQRERVGNNGSERIAGIRTFPLITILGVLAAVIAESFGGWVIGAAIVAVIASVVIGTIISIEKGQAEQGITTEIAILVMFLVGCLLVTGPREVAVVVGGGTALLLHAKHLLHDFANKLGEQDVRAIMQFALVSLVVLPVLPDRTYGPFPLNVLNPYSIWLLVVLVVGINVAGYLIYKFLGARAGVVLGGVLGGLISSTATTLSFARRSRTNPEEGAASAAVVMIASTVLWVRIIVLTIVVGGPLIAELALPIGVMLMVSVAIASLMFMRASKEEIAMPEHHNPSNLRDALIFAGIFALVLVGMAWFQREYGSSGVYGMAAVSGLTDMDAITLSTARMARSGESLDTAWHAILIAAMANTLFKAVLAGVVGSRQFMMRLLPGFGVIFAAAAVVLMKGWVW